MVKLLLSQQQSNANSIAISNLKKNKHERIMKNYHGMEWSQQLAYQMMYM